MEIKDSDIATVEALHDLLLDYHGYKLDHPTLKKARKLTNRMYEDIKLSPNNKKYFDKEEANIQLIKKRVEEKKKI